VAIGVLAPAADKGLRVGRHQVSPIRFEALVLFVGTELALVPLHQLFVDVCAGIQGVPDAAEFS
jgi:hypothetical protein